MFGPRRDIIDAQINESFNNRSMNEKCAADLAVMLLSLKAGQSVAVERGKQEHWSDPVFVIHTKGVVNLDA